MDDRDRCCSRLGWRYARLWIEHGDVVSLLEEFVLERGIDLLVLGARGQNALARC